MNYFTLLTLFFSLTIGGLPLSSAWSHEAPPKQASQEVASSSWKDALAFAREHFPQEGKLIMKSDGFVYLKVDDAYIHALFPMLGLSEEGYREPPYFRSYEAPGAHISVIYEDENVIPEEIGETFHFTLKEIVIVQPTPKVCYAVLQVDSPELERLREKYGLSPKLHGYEYHISLAKKILFVKKGY